MPSLEPDGVRETYEEMLPRLRDLGTEVVHTLNTALSQKSIKVDAVESRIKTLDSILGKCKSKSIYNPFIELHDIVGARIICLFRSSMSSLDTLIHENFSVIDKDDKVSDNISFGYMSVHYICTLRGDVSGPRYNNIKDLRFELQVRTLCMHAWAAVSHYLAYKNDTDLPREMTAAFNALSGLFYVADTQFEQVFRDREGSKTRASASVASPVSDKQPIDLDKFIAYLDARFPDREPSPESERSEALKEISEAGYKNIWELDRDIDRAQDALEKYEDSEMQGGRKFTDVGATRVSLAIANRKFRAMKYSDIDDTKDYEHWLRADIKVYD